MQHIVTSSDTKSSSPKNESAKLNWKQQKEEQANIRKKAAKLKRTEDEINETETKLKSLEEELNLPENATNSVKLNELHTQITTLSNALENLYEIWETLAEDTV